jgi:hypothetical protein
MLDEDQKVNNIGVILCLWAVSDNMRKETYCNDESESESVLPYDWLFNANHFVLAPSPLRPTSSILFSTYTCSHRPYISFSLTRGWVCRLRLLLVLASAVILTSESRRTHDHILLSQIRDSPTWRAMFPCLYPPGTGWPGYSPRHWVPFTSPPTTRRATVEVFDPASTWDWFNPIKINSLYSSVITLSGQ